MRGPTASSDTEFPPGLPGGIRGAHSPSPGSTLPRALGPPTAVLMVGRGQGEGERKDLYTAKQQPIHRSSQAIKWVNDRGSRTLQKASCILITGLILQRHTCILDNFSTTLDSQVARLANNLTVVITLRSVTEHREHGSWLQIHRFIFSKRWPTGAEGGGTHRGVAAAQQKQSSQPSSHKQCPPAFTAHTSHTLRCNGPEMRIRNPRDESI